MAYASIDKLLILKISIHDLEDPWPKLSACQSQTLVFLFQGISHDIRYYLKVGQYQIYSLVHEIVDALNDSPLEHQAGVLKLEPSIK